MNAELYETLTDDAVEAIVHAADKLRKAKGQLFKAGQPGVRFANRDVDPIIEKLNEALKAIDQLPAGDQS